MALLLVSGPGHACRALWKSCLVLLYMHGSICAGARELDVSLLHESPTVLSARFVSAEYRLNYQVIKSMESLFRRYLEFSMMLAIKIIFHFIIEKMNT